MVIHLPSQELPLPKNLSDVGPNYNVMTRVARRLTDLGFWVWSSGQANRMKREAIPGRFVCSAPRFIPHEHRKKTFSLYIYKASNKTLSKILQKNYYMCNSKFLKLVRTLLNYRVLGTSTAAMIILSMHLYTSNKLYCHYLVCIQGLKDLIAA